MEKTYDCSKVKRTCAFSANCGGSTYICDYLGQTGHIRGCPGNKCDKYLKRTGRKRKGAKADE